MSYILTSEVGPRAWRVSAVACLAGALKVVSYSWNSTFKQTASRWQYRLMHFTIFGMLSWSSLACINAALDERWLSDLDPKVREMSMTWSWLSWAWDRVAAMLQVLIKLLATWLIKVKSYIRYDRPKKYSTILCGRNLWLQPLGSNSVSATLGFCINAQYVQKPIHPFCAVEWSRFRVPAVEIHYFWAVTSKHSTLNQCRSNVGPSSATLAQNWTYIGVVFVDRASTHHEPDIWIRWSELFLW